MNNDPAGLSPLIALDKDPAPTLRAASPSARRANNPARPANAAIDFPSLASGIRDIATNDAARMPNAIAMSLTPWAFVLNANALIAVETESRTPTKASPIPAKGFSILTILAIILPKLTAKANVVARIPPMIMSFL